MLFRSLVHETSAAHLQESIEAAFASVTARERRVLYQRFVQGHTIDDLAASFAVHRSTAARWVERAKAHVRTRARKHLAARVGAAEEHDLDDLVGQLRERLEISVGLLLESASGLG